MHVRAFEFGEIRDIPRRRYSAPLATTTERVRRTVCPPLRRSRYCRAPDDMSSSMQSTSSGIAISAPNFCAWL